MSRNFFIILIVPFIVSLLTFTCSNYGINDNFFERITFPHSASKEKKWRYIVIHHSGSMGGSAHYFHWYHKRKNWGGLAYHFVINNGIWRKDGLVQAGSRWMKGEKGAHVKGIMNHYNVYGIGICLVGNIEKSMPTEKQGIALVQLTHMLMKTYNIQAENILGHRQVPHDKNKKRKANTNCPGKYISIKQFRLLMNYIEKKSTKKDYSDEEMQDLLNQWRTRNPGKKIFPNSARMRLL